MNNSSSVSNDLQRFDRRRFLGMTGGALLASSGLASLGADRAFASTSQATTVVRMHHDAAVGPLFKPYVDYFNKRYAPLQVQTSYVPQDYFTVTETQLAGGSVDYDVLFSDEGYLERWYRNGWIRPIDTFPGVSSLLSNMEPGVEHALRAHDGTLVALPYFRGAEIFVYNASHLSKIGAKPPSTWTDFVTMCTQLKKKGISQTPYSPFWIKYAFLIWHELATEAAADGAGAFFGSGFKPSFASDRVVINTLNRWKMLYASGLVPQDIFTTAYGDIVNIFAGGHSSFTLRYQPQVKGFRDPKQSTVAHSVRNALMPGKTHTTHSFGAYWFMAKSTPQPDAAWALMTYLAGKDKFGQYYVPQHLIDIDLGLASGYKSVDNDPSVSRSWGSWADVALLNKQLSMAVSLGPVVNQPWYSQFATLVSGVLQDAVRGSTSISSALKQAADFVNSHRLS